MGQTTALRNGFHIRFQMERIWRDSYSVGLQGKAWERLHLGAQHRRIPFISCPSGDGNRTPFRKLWFFVLQTQGNRQSLKSILKRYIILLLNNFKLVLVSFEYKQYNRISWNGSDIFVIVILFLFIPPWRWPNKWSKHVGGYPVITLHQNDIVHLLVLILY